MTIIIKIKFGSEFQREYFSKSCLVFLKTFKSFFENRHKKNMFDIEIKNDFN